MKLDPEQIYAIIQAVFGWIKECKGEEATDEAIEAEFLSPGARTQVRLRRETKRASGLKGLKWRKAEAQLMAQVHAERRSFKRADIKAMIAEATEED